MNRKKSLLIPWETFDHLNDAWYVKCYMPSEFGYHEDGKIVGFNLRYCLGLIDRLRKPSEEFKNIFDKQPGLFEILQNEYDKIVDVNDVRLVQFRERILEQDFTDKHLFPTEVAKAFINDDIKVIRDAKYEHFAKKEDSIFPDGSLRKVSTTKLALRLNNEVIGILGFSKEEFAPEKELQNKINEAQYAIWSEITQTINRVTSEQFINQVSEDVKKFRALSKNERDVLRLLIFTDTTQKKIAACLGLTYQAVKQIIGRLKKCLGVKESKDFKLFGRRLGMDPYF